MARIDLDRCRNRRTGAVTAWAEEIIERFSTYTEISPSGKGLKLFFLVASEDAPAIAELMNDKARRTFAVGDHREIALDRERYYTVTDQSLKADKSLQLVSLDVVRWVLEDVGPRFKEQHGKSPEKSLSRDESGSGFGFRFLRDCKQRGMNYGGAWRAILADKGKAGEWAHRKDERDIKLAWDNAVAPEKNYEMVRASDVHIRRPQWLWPGHLLRGNQELLAGIKGLGKSQLQCNFVACATTGRDWPDGAHGIEPGNVIMVTAEDALDQVVVPRLMAAGADLQRVNFLKAIRQDSKRRMFMLGEDIEQLERMISDIAGVVLVTIDPITAFMGKINSSSPTDVRGQLGPLTDLAERTNVAFSTVTHLPKQGGPHAIDHFIGSQAFIAAARIGHLCVPEMQISDGGHTVPTGRNLFAIAATNHQKMSTLVYRIEETVVQQSYTPGDRAAAIRARANQVETVFISWEGTKKISADEALGETTTRPSQTGAAVEFLQEVLA
ncbi:MAG TPA: AAA family ATPase, partial [Xanthobacteraceae bacterium]|nr:AAA family ATPase [Xanthobacteraceae bacterium]